MIIRVEKKLFMIIRVYLCSFVFKKEKHEYTRIHTNTKK